MITEFIKSQKFLILIAIIGSLLALLISFGLGVVVGYHKARFSYQWGENYERNFAGMGHGPFKAFGRNGFINGHGVAGNILKIDGQNIIIKGRDNTEQTIIVTDTTIIRDHNATIKFADLKPDMIVVGIGTPNDKGQIIAKLIRVMPMPVVSPVTAPQSNS